MSFMNSFDLTVSGIILFIGLKGLFNGAVREMAALVGVALGVWIASRYATGFGHWIDSRLLHSGSPSASAFLGFLIILTVLWILFVILGIIAHRRFAEGRHTLPDRLLGVLFASVKMFIIFSVIFYALDRIEFVHKNSAPYVASSRLFPWFMKTGSLLVHLDKPPVAGTVEEARQATAEAQALLPESRRNESNRTCAHAPE